MNILGITLDYLMLKDDKVRGDVRQRQLDYAKLLTSLTLIVYSPKELELKPMQWADNLWVYPTNSNNKATFIIDAYKIASHICRESKIDAITTEDPFTTGFIGYLLKKRYRKNLNVQSHVDFCDNPYWVELRKINRLFNRLGKFVLKRSDTIRVGTSFEKEKLFKKLSIPEDKIFVIPVNSEINNFKNVDGSKIRTKYLNDSFEKLLLFTGRLVAQKDIATLLNAFNIVTQKRPKTLLMIVGSGIQEDALKSLSSKLRLTDNVIFTGNIDHNSLPEYVSACDIYTIASIFEGTCIAMAEAMAAEKPVVATRFAGAEDLIVDGENGFVIEQKDYKKMAERILFLFDNPEKAKKMGKKGMKRVDEIFSKNQNIDRVIELWKKTSMMRNA